ncbi:MAG: NAD+ synthase [bacterium]
MIISLAQLNFSNANIEHNFNTIIKHLDNFYDSNIVIFPELFLTGYLPNDLLLTSEYKDIVNSKINKLKDIINKKKLINKIFILGAPLYKYNKIYNSAFIFFNNKIYNYNKIFLPNHGVFDEKRYFEQGNSFIIFKINYNNKVYNFSLLICEDIWADFSPIYYLKYNYNISVFIIINASPFEINKQNKRLDLLTNKAKEVNSFFIYVNNVGLFDDVLFDGNSFIVDNTGKVIYNLENFKEQIYHFNLSNYLLDSNNSSKKITKSNLKKIFKNKINKYFNFYKNFKVNFINYNIPFKEANILLKQEKVQDNNNLEDKDKDKDKGKDKLIYEALIFGIKEYFKRSGFKSAVIGLSGGIDSAVCLVLLKYSINNVIPIIMPTKFNKQSSIEDAIKLCKNLNLNYFIVNINDFYFSFRDYLKNIFNFKDNFDISDENLQARIRAIILMYYANKTNSLVIATSNKSEVSVGYFTLYGDSIGAIAPLKDLYKFQVYSLANYINKIHNNVIPKEIIIKIPSAELRDNQKDEDDIPNYSLLDKVLYYHLEKKFNYSQIKKELEKINFNLDYKLFLDIIKRIYINEYKRYQTPLGFKISDLSFTKERRIPILNNFYNDINLNSIC